MRRRDGERLWAVVLAGGEGVRLRPLTRRIYGEDRPKQYAALLGDRSLLRHTLDRVARAIAPERTVVVTLASHARYTAAEFARSTAPRILAQPHNRGTGAGILYPAHWIQERDAGAIVAIFPSDHFVLEADLFMTHVLDLADFVRREPQWIAVLGVAPTEPETEYGWIEPGERIGWTARGPVYRVRRFLEKPTVETARLLFAIGGLWNTLVVVANVATLVEAGQIFLPALHEPLARSAALTPGDAAMLVVREAFLRMPTSDFSRSLLEVCPTLAVSKAAGLTWSDLGTPRRVRASLVAARMTRSWLSAGSIGEG